MTAPPRSLPFSFTGEVALVTGAASGIGAATTELLAGAGLQVLALDRTPVSRTETGGAAGSVTTVTADITDEAGLDEVIRAHVGDAGLSYLANCAGIHAQSGFDDAAVTDWRRILDVNLVGAFTVTRVVSPWLRRAPAAAVVNVTSLEAHRVVALVNPDPALHYAASKAGLEMLTRGLARTLAGDGVRVNAVAPGVVATPMALGNHHNPDGAIPKQLKARIPLQRYASAAEIASSIAFLLSDQAAYITGSTLLVDGGFSTT